MVLYGEVVGAEIEQHTHAQPARRRPSPNPRPGRRPAPGPGVLPVDASAYTVGAAAGLLEPVSDEAESSRSVLVRGGGWNAAAQLSPILVNLALTPYVIHGLGLARFGLYILAVSIADFFSSFDGGLYAAAQRYFAVYAGQTDRKRSRGGRYLRASYGIRSGYGVSLFSSETRRTARIGLTRLDSS